MMQREPSQKVRVLVLLPTRELAIQKVNEEYEKLRGKQLSKAALVIGGVSEKNQIQAVRSGASLVIATPGRLQDFITRRLIELREVKILVLDEADRMLDMGFLPGPSGASWRSCHNAGKRCASSATLETIRRRPGQRSPCAIQSA